MQPYADSGTSEHPRPGPQSHHRTSANAVSFSTRLPDPLTLFIDPAPTTRLRALLPLSIDHSTLAQGRLRYLGHGLHILDARRWLLGSLGLALPRTGPRIRCAHALLAFWLAPQTSLSFPAFSSRVHHYSHLISFPLPIRSCLPLIQFYRALRAVPLSLLPLFAVSALF